MSSRVTPSLKLILVIFFKGGFYFVQTKWSAPGLPLSSKKQVNWSSSPFKASPSNTSSGAPGVSVWDKFEEMKKKLKF